MFRFFCRTFAADFNNYTTEPNAVFRTAAEISAKLTYQGNIRQPMSLANLGKLLQREGYLQKRCTGGVRKYVVRELQNTAAEKEYEIQQLRTE